MSYTIAFAVDSVQFTKGILAGTESLGGSESACVGLARALATRGHDVHIVTGKIDEDCVGCDAAGVQWHDWRDFPILNQFLDFDVFVSLRMPAVFGANVRAKLRVLWNQDLLNTDQFKQAVMALAWAYDRVVYVSEYHQKQWEGVCPDLKDIGWVTKNGYDPAHVVKDVERHWNRIVHISRPERGLTPLLAMWPKLRERVPDAELTLCRYSSMYDAGGWGQICAQYDRAVEAVNEKVGGITYLGELGKPALYQAIASASIMWYPGVVSFAETSCIAAVEAQANGTPFVGSFKGALPETVPGGVLIPGDAMSSEYQAKAIDAVAQLMDDCRWKRVRYRDLQKVGKAHVQAGYTFATIAGEWERWIGETFAERYEANKLGILRQLLHYDDHTAALHLVDDIAQDSIESGRWLGPECDPPADVVEAHGAADLCRRVIAGKDHTAENYAERALPDPLAEWDANPRFHEVAPLFAKATNVLDVACGNGSFAIGLAATFTHLKVVGVDYADGNIARAKAAAIEAGVADRVTFYAHPCWDFDTQAPPVDGGLASVVAQHGPFDALFCGEFLEHVADAPRLIDSLEQHIQSDAVVAYTCPHGPFGELVGRLTPHYRGHVHHFTHADLTAVFKQKADLHINYFSSQLVTPRGNVCANWIISYRTKAGKKAQARPTDTLVPRLRPKPRLSVGIITHNAEQDILKCLGSVWDLADEIVIGDTGSTDQTKAIAQAFDPHSRKIRVIDIPSVQADPDGFSGARNKVLDACTGDWFLWIDADECLMGSTSLWRYLDADGGVYNGFVIRQNHLQLDAPQSFDRPCRLFRRRSDIRFYGCVHEQPQMGDCNTDIQPSLEVLDVQIAHVGYLTEGVRVWKMRARNLPLLERDMARFPDRMLGTVLVMRDLVNLGDMEVAQHGGLTPRAKQYFGQCVGLWDRIKDPAHRYYGLGRPFYERAISHTASAFEVEIAMAGKQQGMGELHAQPNRIWVRSFEELQAHIAQELDAKFRQTMQPAPLDLEPIAPAPTPHAQETAA